MDEWLENFAMCEEIMSEILKDLGNPQEQDPPPRNCSQKEYPREKQKNRKSKVWTPINLREKRK